MPASRYNILLQILIALTLLIIAGCSGRPADSRLLSLNTGKIETSPHEALDSLAAIDPGSLSEADRHFYDLLTVKARDKAYITHTSDSLILNVVKYAATHKNAGYYPEALYYAARVYTDMGDLPTSLRYFQSALDALPPKGYDPKLKEVIISQTGRLLDKLRLYKDAVKYLGKGMELSSKTDSLGMMYDYQLLGQVYMHMAKYKEAMDCFDKAIAFSENLPSYNKALLNVYRASVEYRRHNDEKALEIIRHMPDSVEPMAQSHAMSVASKIYFAAGIRDTAAIYARALIKDSLNHNRHIGYYMMLRSGMNNLIPPDSIGDYVEGYVSSIEDNYDEAGHDASILQHTSYNYSIQERDKNIVMDENKNLQTWIFICVVVIAILIIVILIIVMRRQTKSLNLWEATERIRQINMKEPDQVEEIIGVLKSKEVKESLMDRRREELSKLLANEMQELETSIAKSDTFHKIKKLADEGKSLPEKGPEWQEIEDVVFAASPRFKETLSFLTGSKMKTTDYTLALMLKLRLSTNEIATLLSRSPNAISTRKKVLSTKIFGEEGHIKELEKLIALITAY